MLKKVIGIVMIICVVACLVTTVSASSYLNKIFDYGSKLNGTGGSMGTALKSFITDTIQPMIELIGNLIFAAVTVILGLKYIWSSAEGRAEVQESLPAFVVAVVFFYLAGSLVNVLTGTSSTTGILEYIGNSGNWTSFAGRVMYIITTIVKYAALAGLVFMGIKYMMASAEGKSSMKTSMGGMVIGILFVFLASNVVNFFVSAGKQIIQ